VLTESVADNSSDILRAGAGSSSRTYDITSVPQKWMNNRTQAVMIGNVVGGSSAINGMAFMRGTSDEYDGWAEIGGPNSTWNWQGVLPYFKRVRLSASMIRKE
jgi:choline dehydrogenase-like flavoprotein